MAHRSFTLWQNLHTDKLSYPNTSCIGSLHLDHFSWAHTLEIVFMTSGIHQEGLSRMWLVMD